MNLFETSLPLTAGYCCRQGIHCCVCPQPLMNKDIKVKDNKQKPKGACPAQTEADSELAAEDNSVLPCLQQYLCCAFALCIKGALI